MNQELQSSHVYIDRLYAELQAQTNKSPLREAEADFERKEMEWVEVEQRYSKRIKELERQLAAVDSKEGVSMECYMKVAKQSRRYKLEAEKNGQTIECLKASIADLRKQLDGMQGNVNGGKSLRALQIVRKSKVAPQLQQRNDENVAPSNSQRQDLGKKQLLRGKQLNRTAAVKAAGGRKALSEQLKRARRIGEKGQCA